MPKIWNTFGWQNAEDTWNKVEIDLASHLFCLMLSSDCLQCVLMQAHYVFTSSPCLASHPTSCLHFTKSHLHTALYLYLFPCLGSASCFFFASEPHFLTSLPLPHFQDCLSVFSFLRLMQLLIIL